MRSMCPFYRVMDLEATGAREGGRRKLVDRGRVFHRVKGSGRRILDPLQTLILNTARIVENVESQPGGAAGPAYAPGQPTRGADGPTRSPGRSRPITGDVAEIKKYLIAAGVPAELFEPNPDTGADPVIDAATLWTVFRPVRHNPAQGRGDGARGRQGENLADA